MCGTLYLIVVVVVNTVKSASDNGTNVETWSPSSFISLSLSFSSSLSFSFSFYFPFSLSLSLSRSLSFFLSLSLHTHTCIHIHSLSLFQTHTKLSQCCTLHSFVTFIPSILTATDIQFNIFILYHYIILYYHYYATKEDA
jgi:hypothetical protein